MKHLVCAQYTHTLAHPANSIVEIENQIESSWYGTDAYGALTHTHAHTHQNARREQNAMIDAVLCWRYRNFALIFDVKLIWLLLFGRHSIPFERTRTYFSTLPQSEIHRWTESLSLMFALSMLIDKRNNAACVALRKALCSILRPRLSYRDFHLWKYLLINWICSL